MVTIFRYIQQIFKLPKRNIYEMMFPFFVVFKAFNVIIFTIDGSVSNGRVSIHIKDYIQIVLVMCFDIFLLYLSLTTDYNKTSIYLLNFGNNLFVIFAISFSFFAHISIVFNYRNLWDVYTLMHEFDLEMEKLKYPVDNKSHFKFLMWGFMVGMTYSLTLLTTIIKVLDMTIIEGLLSQVIPNGTSCMVMTLYYSYVVLLFLRFYKLNQFIKMVLTSNPLKTQSFDNVELMIKHVGRLYEHLNRGMDIVNNNLGLQVLFCISSFFIYLVFSFFAAYLMYKKYDSETMTVVTMNLLFCAIFSCMYLCVIASGTLVAREVR